MRNLIILFLVAFLFTVANSAVLLIPEDFEIIQDAIEESEDGDTLLVEEGSYNESIDFNGRDIVIASMYLLDGEEDHITNTFIDADGLNQRCVTIESGETEDAQLIGFTIINGFADYGGGIYCRNTRAQLSHLRVYDNHAQRHGGGMYCTTDGDPTLYDVAFISNSASHPEEDNGYGGAISTRGSSPILSYCLIVNNEAERYGGGIYSTNEGSPLLDHVTISGNAAGVGRGGIHFRENALPSLINSIHWGNTPADLSAGLNITYSDVQGEYEGEGNINQDPLFIDPENGDYGLQEGSPCIDTGDPDTPEDPDGTRADMGAVFFHQFPRVEIHPDELDFRTLNIGETRDLNVTVRNNSAVDLRIIEVLIIPDDAPFSVVEGGAGILGQDEEMTIVIRFAPDGEGALDGILRILSNDHDTPQVDLHLMGVGLPPVPNISVAPGFIIFGEAPLREEQSVVLTISSIGDLALIVNSVELTGGGSEQFRTDFQDVLRIEPGDHVELSVGFYPIVTGDFAVTLNVNSNDPNEGVLPIRITGSGVLPEFHFDAVSRTGVNHSLMILDATLDDEDLVYGSQIAVFAPSGLCCGTDYWLGEQIGLAAWGDNEITEEVDGLLDDQEMSFQIWDLTDHAAYPAEARYVRGSGIYHANGISVLTLPATREELPQQERFMLHLQYNWNLISSPIILGDDNVVHLWWGLGQEGSLAILKDYAGRFYNPEFDFCNIPRWDFHQGYQAKMNDLAELEFTGQMAAADTPIPMVSGWNIVAYLPADDIDAITGFANIVDIMTIAKDGMGRFYMPEFGFSNMVDLTRGQGYQVNVRQQAQLVWNLGQNLNAAYAAVVSSPVHFPILKPTGGNMSLLILGADLSLPANSELAAFTPEGLCVGSTALTGEGPWGMAVWADDATTPELDGSNPQTPLQFKIWSWGQEFALKPTWQAGNNSFEIDQFRAISISSKGFLPHEFTLSGLYPNPFNSQVTLSFFMPDAGSLELTIHNMLGREIKHLRYTGLTAGLHEITWDAEGIPSGVYIFRLESGAVTRLVKAALLR